MLRPLVAPGGAPLVLQISDAFSGPQWPSVTLSGPQ
jgi:hypothetical protein